MVEDNIDFTKFKYCEYGCKTIIPIKDKYGVFRRYYYNHHTKGKLRGSERRLRNNYWWIYKPEHYRSYKSGWILEHIYIFQEYYKCCILKWGNVHHIIPVKEGGTNDISNLQAMMKRKHISFHNSKRLIGNQYNKKDLINRRCSNSLCKTSTVTGTNKDGYYIWYKDNNGGFWCKRCYSRIKYYEKKMRRNKFYRLSKL